MKRRYFRALTLAAAVFCFLMLTGAQGRADTQAELDAALKKIDMQLYRQSEADIRAWLDARIKASGGFGVYPFTGTYVRISGNRATVDLNRGMLADTAAQFLRASEMLGDRKYLEAGLKTADFFLEVQQPAGNFPSGATILRGRKATAGGGKHPPHVARMEDGYQFRPFALLLYAYKLTGGKKYLDGAKRCGEMVTQHMQHPQWGWCPDNYDAAAKRVGASYGSRGGSYSDFATTDGFRMSIIMYHLTKDKKHLERSAKLGDWIFATQLGRGKVRGWGDNYDANNKPVGARSYEGTQIDPRNFCRFVGPQLAWLYAMTGEQKYRKLFEESYTWMRSVEKPDGWAWEYTAEGKGCATLNHKLFLYEEPEKWPNNEKPGYTRGKVHLRDSKTTYDTLQKGGRDALRRRHGGPVKYSEAQYLEARLAAARRCTDEDLVLRLERLDSKPAREYLPQNAPAKYLARVRLRLAAPNSPNLPQEARVWRTTGLFRQAWLHAYHPPLGHASWQYVWDARLALGKIDPDTAAPGGRGLETMYYPLWNVMGDWAVRCIEVEDWMDVPLAGSRERRIPLSKATSAWGYYGVPPESPDGKRLCYALYPKAIDLARKERYPVYPAELWVCNRDGGGHRMLYKGRSSVHNGFGQSWGDNTRIVFASEGATRIVNADTGKVQFGPFAGFSPAHFAMAGKVLMHNAYAKSAKQRGLYEFDTATGKMRLVLPYTKSISHVQYSPDGRKALFTTKGNFNLAVVNLDGTGLKVLPDQKPMHFQWFDNQSLFGYARRGVVGVDPNKHHDHELYRWNLEGKIIEHLAGYGCHGAARADRKYFVGESWYRTKPIALRLYARGRREPLTTIFSHSFFQLTWQNGGRHHVNPSFSRDGARVYYNKAVNENTSQAFCCDLTGLAEPMK